MYLTLECDVFVVGLGWKIPEYVQPLTVYFVKAEHFAALFIFQECSSERDPTMKSSLPQEETLNQVKHQS